MDPLLWATYFASAALGPATLAIMSHSCFTNGQQNGSDPMFNNGAIISSITYGLVSIPRLRRYSEVSRNLEACVFKQPKVKCYPNGMLKAIPYSEARRDALEAAIPVWFYFSFPSLICALATENKKRRTAFSLLGLTCASMAFACKVQSVVDIVRIDKQDEDSPRMPAKPMLYFNNTNSDAAVLDEYSAEVKRILENKKKQQKNASDRGFSSFWSKFGTVFQRKQPEHGNVRVILAGMK